MKLFHFHRYNKPVYSKYLSFNCREITYECSCGKEKSRKVCKHFSDPFPIPTDHYDRETIKLIKKIKNDSKSMEISK